MKPKAEENQVSGKYLHYRVKHNFFNYFLVCAFSTTAVEIKWGGKLEKLFEGGEQDDGKITVVVR